MHGKLLISIKTIYKDFEFAFDLKTDYPTLLIFLLNVFKSENLGKTPNLILTFKHSGFDRYLDIMVLVSI